MQKFVYYILTAIEEIFAKEVTTGDMLSVCILYSIILYLRRYLLHHLATETSVHLRVSGFIGGLLEDELNDLDERPTVLLLLGLVRPSNDLIGDGIEPLHGKLVEESLGYSSRPPVRGYEVQEREHNSSFLLQILLKFQVFQNQPEG